MISFLITLVIFCIVAWILYLIVQFIVGHFGLPSPIPQIIYAIFGLILLLAFLDMMGLYSSGVRWPRLR